MIQKKFISPNELRRDSYALAAQAFRAGFRPDFMVALWRGGAPIGCHVHEYFKWHKVPVDHIAIRTSRYTGIDETEEDGKVLVHSTSYLCERLKPGMSVMLVDDVWDSGTSIQAFFDKLHHELPFPLEQISIRVAVLYFKPERNKLTIKPAYYLHMSNEWLVFPHELEGMSLGEIASVMGDEIAALIQK